VADRLFTEFIRDNHPLEKLLDRWSHTARANFELLRKRDFDSATDNELLGRLLEEWTKHTTPRMQRVGEPDLLERPGSAFRRDPDNSIQPSVWRWVIRFRIRGDTEPLGTWPAEFSREPCRNDVDWMPISELAWEMSDRGPLAVIDVLATDDPKGIAAPIDRYRLAASYLDEAIAASNAEIGSYDARLREDLLLLIRDRRGYLSGIATQHSEVLEMLRVEALPLNVFDAAPKTAAPSTPGSTGPPIALSLVVGERTFADLISVTQKWAAGVARYPAPFEPLDEETLSSLLIPTLNVAFDTAHREVFNVGGKTDIYVEHDRGDRSRAAFFGEAKVWRGPARVHKDVEQIFRYSNCATREAMLLYYVKRKRFSNVVDGCRAAISRVPGFVRWDGNDRAVIKHSEYGQELEVHLVFVHIPPAR